MIKNVRLALIALAVLGLCAAFVGLSNIANADRAKQVTTRTMPGAQPTKLQKVDLAWTTPALPMAQLYDTLGFQTAVGAGFSYPTLMTNQRIYLNSLTLYGDDSASGTPSVIIRFFNASNKNVLARFNKTFAAGEISTTSWQNLNLGFPYDTTVVMQVYTGAGTLDSMNVNAVWELDNRY